MELTKILWLIQSAQRIQAYFTGDVMSFSFLPVRIIEIWRPLLNAWLKSSRAWNSDTNGNHDEIAMGMNNIRPITYSYALASSFIDSQNPKLFNTDLSACPIYGWHNTKRENMGLMRLLHLISDICCT